MWVLILFFWENAVLWILVERSRGNFATNQRGEADYRIAPWGKPVICATGIIKHGGSGQTDDFYTNISGNGWQTLKQHGSWYQPLLLHVVMFTGSWDVTYVRILLAVQNYLLHWSFIASSFQNSTCIFSVCFLNSQHVLLSTSFHTRPHGSSTGHDLSQELAAIYQSKTHTNTHDYHMYPTSKHGKSKVRRTGWPDMRATATCQIISVTPIKYSKFC